MKGEKITSGLIAVAICFCMGFGAVACVATGLQLGVDLSTLCIGCLLGALVAATGYSLRNGGRILLAAGALYLLGALFYADLFDSALTLCRDATRIYSRAYGFSVPQLLEDCDGTSPLLVLLVVAGFINLVTAWIMLHRFPSALAIFVAIVPFASCFVVTDTVPEIWALGLWLLGMGLLVLTQSCRIRDARAANRLTGLVVVPLLLVLSMLFSLVPQAGFQPPVDQSQLQGISDWALQNLPFVGQTSNGTLVINFGGDRSDHVNLSALDDRNLSGSPVAEVESERGGKLYLRGRDYDAYTGTGWKSTGRTEEFSTPSLTGQPYKLQVQVFGNRKQKMIPYYTGNSLTTKDGVVAASSRSYEFTVVPLDDNWAALWRASKPQSADAPHSRYLSLPAGTASTAQSILAEIPNLKGADTVAAAEAIAGYVSWSANYSLRVDRMPSNEEDFAVWFLQDATQGYCVHFATATAVLLRAHGIPARYVEGYMLDVDAGEISEIPQSASHAWVEYFVEGVGWVVLDATPGLGQDFDRPEAPTQPSTPKPTTRPSTPTHPTDPTETEPSTPTTTKPPQTTPPSSSATQPSTEDVSTPSESESGFGSGVGTGGAPGGSGAGSIPSEPESMPEWLVWTLVGLGILAATLAAVIGQWFLRRLRRIRRLHQGNANQQVIALHREAAQICKLLHADMPEELASLARKAAFSQHNLTAEELATAGNAYRHCRDRLQKGRWYQQLLWRFVYALY